MLHGPLLGTSLSDSIVGADKGAAATRVVDAARCDSALDTRSQSTRVKDAVVDGHLRCSEVSFLAQAALYFAKRAGLTSAYFADFARLVDAFHLSAFYFN